MPFLRSAFSRSDDLSSLTEPRRWLSSFFGAGGPTAAGIEVGVTEALSYGPVLAAVQVIAGDLGSLPLITYERLERGKRRATEHPLYPLLHNAPNEFMTAVGLREMTQGHALTWGNGASYIERDKGRVVGLWPLHPGRIHPRITHTGRGKVTLVYDYADQVNGINTTLLADEVLHIAGLGGDGIRGYSIVRLAAESIALGIAAEKYGGSWFGNGSRPSGFLRTPGNLSDEAGRRLKSDWEAMHRGLDKAQRIAILEEGLEWQALGVPPEDAQFLETRKFSVNEIARWFRLPPHKIGDLERSTFSNIEQQQIDYVSSALRVWLVRWEQSIAQRLLGQAERRRYFCEHLLDALLRGDTKTRYEAYAIARNWGWMSADDIAEAENRNPLPDGRGAVYLVPLNMVPAPTLAEATQAAGRDLHVVRGRGVQSRRRIADTFKPLIRDADLRLAKLERDKVTALVAKHLDAGRAARHGRDVDTLKADLQELYRGLVTDKTLALWLPVFQAFSEAIIADAAADVGYTDPVDLLVWLKAYTESHVGYRIATSLGVMWNLISASADAGAALLELMDKWVADRPDKIARWEGSQIPNATARETWIVAGVKTLRWVAVGDTCPYCASLDGVTVGIDQPFVAAGGEVGDGSLADKLAIDRTTFHPPLHPACDCQVVPG